MLAGVNIEAERILWAGLMTGASPRDTIAKMVDLRMIVSEKEAHATLVKWSERGLYDYGVSVDLGWLTPGAKFPRAA